MIIIAAIQLVVNLALGYTLLAFTFLALVVIGTLIFYAARVKKRYYYFLLIIAVCSVITIDWFQKGGIDGTAIVPLIAAPLAALVMIPTKYFWYFIPPYSFFFGALIYINYHYPQFFGVPLSGTERFIEITIASISIFFVMGWCIYFFRKSYEENKVLIEQQKDKISHAFKRLQATEEELRQNSEELQATNEHLNQEKARAQEALHSLQETQEQLVQAEKMSSLGQLMAGMAHEINNPINFISGGNQVLKETIADLVQLFLLYQALEQTEDEEQRQQYKEEIADLKEILGDFDELQKDIASLSGDISMGVNRVAIIIEGLKTYSIVIDGTKELLDIHQLIDQVWNETSGKDHLQFISQYEANKATIDALADDLKQLFSHLFLNAIEATPNQGSITIKTINLENNLQITIQDSGKGISTSVLGQIFNPFFTTKPVGEGTGLGLSTVYRTVEKYKGTIHAFSEEGEGARFVIQFPVA